MKILLTLLVLIPLSGCAVASLAGTVVSTTAKVIEVPFKAIGKVIESNDDSEEEEKQEDQE